MRTSTWDPQRLAVGDIVPLSPVGGPTVVQLERARTLVLHDTMNVRTGRSVPSGTSEQPALHWSWAFVLQPAGDGDTRLLARTRAAFLPPALRVFGPTVLEPVHFVMERGMLLGLKRRAEAARRGPVPGDVPSREDGKDVASWTPVEASASRSSGLTWRRPVKGTSHEGANR